MGHKNNKFMPFLLALFFVYSVHGEKQSVTQFFETSEGGFKSKIESLSSFVKEYHLDPFGRITGPLQEDLYEIEKRYYQRFNQEEKLQFQQLIALIGGKIHNPVLMPKDDTPFWLQEKGKFFRYRSGALPKTADIVIIGAGLTGASAAYHLAKTQKAIVVLEAGERPASESSGRNGGNFQLLAETYTGFYSGLVEERIKWLRKAKPWALENQLLSQAQKEASILLRFNFQNFSRFHEVIKKEKIACDFSEKGWLRIAASEEEEKALLRDQEWISSQEISGLPFMEFLSSEEIKEKFGITTRFKGRLIHGNGNYHPYKFVEGLFEAALKEGVKLYTQTKVKGISRISKDKVVITTEKGIITAKKVIVATNAATPAFFPELIGKIYTVPSQIMNLEHVENNLGGITITEGFGDLYYNFPSSKTYESPKMRGMVHFGLDDTRKMLFPFTITRSGELFERMKNLIGARFPDTVQQPASRVWVGSMALTDDRVPVIGFKGSQEIIIAAAFQGYGGSFTTYAGERAAFMALHGTTPEDVPAELFSPMRFQSEFMLKEKGVSHVTP